MTFLILAIVFVPTGYHIQRLSDDLTELSVTYDDYKDDTTNSDSNGNSNNNSNNCAISRANQNKTCLITLTVPTDMAAPVLVYYRVTNFFQNHRTYFRSVDFNQLQGELPIDQSELNADHCAPLNKLGNVTLNPCGLRANTLFNDVWRLLEVEKKNENEKKEEEDSTIMMREDGIAFRSDAEYRYGQPIGFRSEQCTSCKDEKCSCNSEEWSCKEPYVDNEGNCHLYFYPDDNTTQYLYETYPMVVNPLEGVTNEHFMVWMRIALLPNFQKLYGWIDRPIAQGTKLTFEIQANWEVQSFRGSKTLVVTTNNALGGKNNFLGPTFYVTGYACLVLGVLFALKQFCRPRMLADERYLEYNSGYKEE